MNPLSVEIQTEDGRCWRDLSPAEQEQLLEQWAQAAETLLCTD